MHSCSLWRTRCESSDLRTLRRQSSTIVIMGRSSLVHLESLAQWTIGAGDGQPQKVTNRMMHNTVCLLTARGTVSWLGKMLSFLVIEPAPLPAPGWRCSWSSEGLQLVVYALKSLIKPFTKLNRVLLFDEMPSPDRVDERSKGHS